MIRRFEVLRCLHAVDAPARYDHRHEAGLLEAARPVRLNSMGAPNACECTAAARPLLSMLEPGDTWTSVGVGKFEMPLAYAAIDMGGM